ncbi:hypothetical protein [Novosphingobium sp. PP1Y]|uniref:hypothetical protein n=1 Tax=Novosphingobium sp. PP1Y TaxID=702113 RepID=UPI00020EF022|nr:hypothetical protein [Novosphingobium sp. PP1Y]CCA93376.1 hypothetical protein PP1Y_AT25907 [Novosphingobium sp. PP1Y]
MAKTALIEEAAGDTKTAEKPHSAKTGTPLANIDLLYSCDLAFRDTVQCRTWGGARIRSGRVSENLTRRQIEGMIAAASYAQATGRTFSRHWTIHYGNAGIPDSEGAAFVRNILKRAGEHIRRAGGDMAAIWSRENGEGKGAHVHILLHAPDGYTFRNRTRRWIEGAGGKYRRGVSVVRVIGGTLASARSNDARHGGNVWNVLAYLMKGADNETGAALELNRHGAGGPIIGKRCGWTQNIGETERIKVDGNNGRSDG